MSNYHTRQSKHTAAQSNISQLNKFRARIMREVVNNNDAATEYELRFGYKTAGKFAPIFTTEIKNKVFSALGITKDMLVVEESINSYYDGNIRKVSIKSATGNNAESIECKEVIKRIDWYMDSGLCLRFAVSNEKAIPADINLDTAIPSVIRAKVREIYKMPGKDTEIHFTTVNMTGIKGDTTTQEMEIEYKKINEFDIAVINKILNCYNN